MQPERKRIGELGALGALVGMIAALIGGWLWWGDARLGPVLIAGGSGAALGGAAGLWFRRNIP